MVETLERIQVGHNVYKNTAGWPCRCGQRIPFGEDIMKRTQKSAQYEYTDYYCIRCAQQKGYLW